MILFRYASVPNSSYCNPRMHRLCWQQHMGKRRLQATLKLTSWNTRPTIKTDVGLTSPTNRSYIFTPVQLLLTLKKKKLSTAFSILHSIKQSSLTLDCFYWYKCSPIWLLMVSCSLLPWKCCLQIWWQCLLIVLLEFTTEYPNIDNLASPNLKGIILSQHNLALWAAVT